MGIKLHLICDSFKVNSGFGIVAKNIGLGLKKLGYNVTASCLQTSYIPEYYEGIKIYPLATDKREDIQLISNIIEENPDLVVYIGDMYTDVSYLARIPLGLGKKIVVHCPVEGYRIPTRVVNDLKEIVEKGGMVIPQSSYGKKEIEKHGIKTVDFTYHGHNPDIFKKLDLKGSGSGKSKDKDKLNYCYNGTEIGMMISDPEKVISRGCKNCIYKEKGNQKDCPFYKEEEFIFLKWFDNSRSGNEPKWTEIVVNPRHLVDLFKGRFIFTFIGANISFRKRPERLMEAYSYMINSSQMMKDRIWLHMHTIPNGTTGFDLLEIANDLGIKENISFSYGMNRNNTMSDEAINILLNMSDCFVSATSSEGMSINHLLAMAVGLSCISPDNTVLTELIGNSDDETQNRGLLAKCITDYTLPDLSKRKLVDQEHLAMMMKKIYNNKELREKLGNNAEKWAKRYTWSNICLEWDSSLT